MLNKNWEKAKKKQSEIMGHLSAHSPRSKTDMTAMNKVIFEVLFLQFSFHRMTFSPSEEVKHECSSNSAGQMDY